MTKLVNETYVCFSYTMLLVEKSFYSYFWKPKSGSTANISLEMWNINPYVRVSFINSVVYWVENNIYKSNLGLVCLKKVSLPSSFSSVQPLSHACLFAISWTAAFQASLSITNSWSLLKFMSIELVISSNHLIFCCPLILLASIFPSIRVFSSGSILCIKWKKYWSFSFSISTSKECSGLISFTIDWFDLLEVQGTPQESSLTPKFKSISSLMLSFLYGPIHTSIHDYWKDHSFD